MSNKNILARLEVIEAQLGQTTNRRRWFQNFHPLVMVHVYLTDYFGVESDLGDKDFFNITGIKSPYYLHGHCENLYDDNKAITQQLIDFCHKHGLDARQNPSYFAAYIIAYYVNFFEDGGKIRNGQLIDKYGQIVDKPNLDWLIISPQKDNETVEDNLQCEEIEEYEETEGVEATKKRKAKTWRYPPAITLFDFD